MSRIAAWRVEGRLLWKTGGEVFWQETCALLKPGWFSVAIIVIFLGLFLPSVTRYTTDAPLLAAYADDEPFITLQLDGMMATPYGNPANFLDSTIMQKQPVPDHWLNMRYYNLPYYGGLYLDLAFAVMMPLKMLGIDTFPTAPIILRLIGLAFCVCTLLAAYNFGRATLGPWAGAASCLFLICNQPDFISIGTMIHPDSLLFFLQFLAMALAIRHALKGDMASLAALGIAAGLAQSAKMGGIQLVPLTALVIAIGVWRQYPPLLMGLLKQVVRRGIIAALIALLVFAVTTPYAFLDPYYFYTWAAWGKKFTGESPLATTVGFMDWIRIFIERLGPAVFWAGAAGALLWLLRWRRHRNRLPVLLYLLFATTLVLWYATLNHYWVQPQYLVISMCLVAAMGGHLIDQLLHMLPAHRQPHATRLAYIVAAVAFTILAKPLLVPTVNQAVTYADWWRNPAYRLGLWSQKYMPRDTRVMWDTQAYFPAATFPDQHMNGGPIRYADLARVQPDYFVLTIYNFPMWMNDKIAADPLPRWADEYANLRLYQDLLGRDPNRPQEQTLAGFQLITSTGAEGIMKRDCAAPSPPWWQWIKSIIGTHCGYDSKTMFLFKLDREAFMKTVPKAKP